MSNKQTNKNLLLVSLAGFLIMSISYVLMAVESIRSLAGGLFWAGLLSGVVLQVVLNSRRKAFFAKYNTIPQKMRNHRIGLLTFGANKPAKIADIVLGVSVLGLAVALLATRGTGIVCYFLIAVVNFTFCLHCVLNGRNYSYIINENKLRQMLEKKTVRTFGKERDRNV